MRHLYCSHVLGSRLALGALAFAHGSQRGRRMAGFERHHAALGDSGRVYTRCSLVSREAHRDATDLVGINRNVS